MYGLEQHIIEAIQSIFASHSSVEKAILYGSRAKGNYRNGSDIDLTLVGENLILSEQFTIETASENLLLPYKIDLSLYHKMDNPNLLDHIEKVRINFYEKKINE